MDWHTSTLAAYERQVDAWERHEHAIERAAGHILSDGDAKFEAIAEALRAMGAEDREILMVEMLEALQDAYRPLHGLSGRADEHERAMEALRAQAGAADRIIADALTAAAERAIGGEA